jgi:hypothetical protein
MIDHLIHARFSQPSHSVTIPSHTAFTPFLPIITLTEDSISSGGAFPTAQSQLE